MYSKTAIGTACASSRIASLQHSFLIVEKNDSAATLMLLWLPSGELVIFRLTRSYDYLIDFHG